jgi:hypothetical protein
LFPNLPFTTLSKVFDNQHDVINWIIDNQLARRNINEDQKAYLIGKKYQEEKKEEGRPKFSPKLDHSDLDTDDKSPYQKIAEQSKVGQVTIKRAEKFTDAVDKVAENVGINPQKI